MSRTLSVFAVCDTGYYGQNCSLPCGHCLGGPVCDPRTGHCEQCDVGYSYYYPICETGLCYVFLPISLRNKHLIIHVIINIV